MSHSDPRSTPSADGAAAVVGLQADRDVLLDLLGALPDELWAAPSGCPGWTVKDLVAHLGALFWTVVDGSVLPDVTGLPTEAAQEVHVAARSGWSPAQVLEDYAAVADRALVVLDRLATRRDRTLDLGDLGRYPSSLLGTAFAFDHYTHLRSDLVAPRGPIGAPVPPGDEDRLRPVLAWVRAALPQQNAEALRALPGAVELELLGPAGATWYVDADGLGVEPPAEVVARVSSTTHDLTRWATRRARWDEAGVVAEGDEAALAVLRDRVKVF